MPRYGKKPLLAEQGILHLDNSFTTPTCESGLLTTVGGGEESALVLAPNYGYALLASDVSEKTTDGKNESHKKKRKRKRDAEHDNDVADETMHEGEGTPKRSCVVENGSPSQNDMDTTREETDGADLSVAHLVRAIGGANNKPIRDSDIIDDEEKAEEPVERVDDAQTDEFYASLGMTKSKDETPKGKETSAEICVINDDSNSRTAPDGNENVTESVAEFYKDYCNFYYSVEPNPFGEDRIEFGHKIGERGEGMADASVIELARAAQKARRAMEATMLAKRVADEKAKLLPEEEESFDPLPTEIVPSDTAEKLGITNDTTTEKYWELVKQDPHDFNRWTYLLQHVEQTHNMKEVRKVYSAFLPLFPYCFGYWQRYAELEKTHSYLHRALTILEKGLEFNPLSVDLWLSYINLFAQMNAQHPDLENVLRCEYERALTSVGLEFRSDSLWDSFIEWEIRNKRLKRAFTLYRRLILIPTRLYNRHWDNLQALVRDHHPRDILEKDEYESLRKKGCIKFNFRYKEEPDIEPGEIIKPSKPEDKLMTYVKDKILRKLKRQWENSEKESNKRWDFEDKIRRPYFHTKPLDKRQLENWEQYLDFEISEKNHDRIVLLFERCLIACAQYEFYWAKYARYVENYHGGHSRGSKSRRNISIHIQKSKNEVDIGTSAEMAEEEDRMNQVQKVMDSLISVLEAEEQKEQEDISRLVSTLVNAVVDSEELQVSPSAALIGHPEDANSSGCPINASINQSVREDEDDSGDNKMEMFSSLLSVPNLPPAPERWQEIVRDIYKRACIVHCPRKPAIRLQWAAFEEELGNVEESRILIQHVLHWFPEHLEAKLALLELERRAGSQSLTQLFEKFIKAGLRKRDELSMLSLKYARYLQKEMGRSDQALTVLRQALKKDKGNPHLYSLVFDICYQRVPLDRKGASAALELALNSKELNDEQKLLFLKKKVLFLQEHGDIGRYRDALEELNSIQRRVQNEKIKKQKEEEKARLEVLRAAELYQQSQMKPYAVPKTTTEVSAVTQDYNSQQPVPIDFIPDEPEVTETLADKSKSQQASYKTVPPTKELLDVSNYGYGSKHPDYKLAENEAHREYERLESKGYEDRKDTEEDKEALRRAKKKKYEEPVYIVAPRNVYMMNHTNAEGAANPPVPGAQNIKILDLESPTPVTMLAIPSTVPFVNVPEAFVEEGGELCISETFRGFSIIRFWPKFTMGEEENDHLFRVVRRCIKWHQKQAVLGRRWRYLPRLVSWLGPCDYSHNGMTLKKNEDWPPEILDLLHRINQLTGHEFNSCSLNLYRSGHDSNGWHSDTHPALGSNPPIASISLGALRLFEMRRKSSGAQNYLRIPLYPGSLLTMEGATQDDWVHQVPKDPSVKAERINLTFRIMHAIDVDGEQEDDPFNANFTKLGTRPTSSKEKVDTSESKKNTKATKWSKEGETNSALDTEEVIDLTGDEPPGLPLSKQTKIIFHEKERAKIKCIESHPLVPTVIPKA